MPPVTSPPDKGPSSFDLEALFDDWTELLLDPRQPGSDLAPFVSKGNTFGGVIRELLEGRPSEEAFDPV